MAYFVLRVKVTPFHFCNTIVGDWQVLADLELLCVKHGVV
jgi:hypothetical protein